MQKYIYLFLLSFIFENSVIGIKAQSTYFVSTQGADANTGSFSQPWKTIDYAVNQMHPGDSLLIRQGTYKGMIDISVSGTDNLPIVIRNYQNEEVNITGNNLLDGQFLIKIENQEYIQISGIIFKDYQVNDAQGVLIINSSHIILSHNEFYNIDYSTNALGQTPTEQQNAQPIIVFGRDSQKASTDIRLLNNKIHDCEIGWSEALSLNGNIDGFEINGNEIYNNTNIGIVAIGYEGECPDPNLDQARNGVIINNLVYQNPSAYDTAAGIYIDGGKNIVVELNHVYRNDYGIEVGCENNGQVNTNPSSSGIIVRNNLIYNNNQAGLVIGGYNYPVTGKVENSIFRNNTLFHNDTSNSYSGELYLSYLENCHIENNIFNAANNDHVLIISENSLSGVDLDYNAYYDAGGQATQIVIEINGTEYNDFSGYQQATGKEVHSFFKNPLLIDVNQPDLHLQSHSPCIDSGNPSTQIDLHEKDIDEQSRKINNYIDIGADEFDPSLSLRDNIKEQILLFPNPVSEYIHIKNISDYNFAIYNLKGQLICQGKNKNKIDCRNLKSGIYFLKIQKELQQVFFKIIKI